MEIKIDAYCYPDGYFQGFIAVGDFHIWKDTQQYKAYEEAVASTELYFQSRLEYLFK